MPPPWSRTGRTFNGSSRLLVRAEDGAIDYQYEVKTQSEEDVCDWTPMNDGQERRRGLKRKRGGGTSITDVSG